MAFDRQPAQCQVRCCAALAFAFLGCHSVPPPSAPVHVAPKPKAPHVEEAKPSQVRVGASDVSIAGNCPAFSMAKEPLPPFRIFDTSNAALDAFLEECRNVLQPAEFEPISDAIRQRRGQDMSPDELLCSLSVREGDSLVDLAASLADPANRSTCASKRDWHYIFHAEGSTGSDRWSFYDLPAGKSLLYPYHVPPGEGAFHTYLDPAGRFFEMSYILEDYKCPIYPELACWQKDSVTPMCDLPPEVPPVACVLDHLEGWWGVYDPLTGAFVNTSVASLRGPPSLSATDEHALVDCQE